MNGFWGADTEALRTMGAVCTRRADALADLEHLLSSTIENLEWFGEDAERFRADWNGTVRSGLQDQEVQLRHHARRLAQHADEQESASAPDGPILGSGAGSGGGPGGGWSSPGESLREVFERTEDALEELLGGGGDTGQDGPFAELLREVLSTPEGRAAFLGSFLGSALGGVLAEMISRALGLGMALENLLTGLGVAAGLSNLLGEATQLPAEAGAEQALTGGGAGGMSGSEGGPAQSLGSWSSGPIRASGDEGPQSLLERLLEMVGDAFGSDAGGMNGSGGSASSIGADIGFGGARR